MSPACSAVLDELAQLGVTVRPEGGSLRIHPASLVSPELKDRLRACKPEILATAGAAKEVMTVEDLPALVVRLEAQGWKIQRRKNNELYCTPMPPGSAKKRSRPDGNQARQRVQSNLFQG